MKGIALAILALAVFSALPASAQSGVPVKNALVVVSAQDDVILQSAIAGGGSPSGVLEFLETVEGLVPVSAPRTLTDEDGRFAVDASLAPDDYNVTVFAPGFVATSERLSIGDATASNITIFMQPSAMVSGRVTDEQGRPIPGIVVAASSPYSINYDITMDDGLFVLDTGLHSGSHDIYAFKPGFDVAELQNLFNDTWLGFLENKVPTIFRTSDAGYVSHASKVQLEQNKLTTLNIQLSSSQVISGRVTAGGIPLQGVAVFAFDSTGAIVNTAAVSDSEGRYILDNNLAPGKYALVIPSLFSKGFAPASIDVTVPAENPVDFALAKSGVIAGRVVDSTGNPVEGAKISAVSKDIDPGGSQLGQFLAAVTATVETDREGRFIIDRGIGNGTYTVIASFGSVPVTSSVDARGGGTASIALDFDEVIRIEGMVTDESGRPIENASVAPAFASAIAGAQLFADRTDPDGTYVLVIPLGDNSTRSLFDNVAVSADGYKSAVVPGNTAAKLEKMPASRITGVAIAQKPLSPPVETVLNREGMIIFEHENTRYEVGLKTNARLLDAAFDHASGRITIELEGVQDAAGRSEFSIPKEFMTGPFAVNLDGETQQGVVATENQTHATIVLEHRHDLREITIQGTTVVPEFPLPALLAAAGTAAAIAWKRLRH